MYYYNFLYCISFSESWVTTNMPACHYRVHRSGHFNTIRPLNDKIMGYN